MQSARGYQVHKTDNHQRSTPAGVRDDQLYVVITHVFHIFHMEHIIGSIGGIP